MPVGCVPSDAVAVFVGGGVGCLSGVSAQEGGVCLGGVCRGGEVCLGGCLPSGGVCVSAGRG